MSQPTHQISLFTLLPKEKQSAINRALVALADKCLGITRMNDIYQANQMQGLSKEAFAEAFLKVFELDVKGKEQLLKQVPKQGPLVIAANHPFGGIEGVILSYLLGQARPDLKVLANRGLKVFPELADYFIFTNPLSEKDPRNGPSLKACMRHVKQGGALLIFPAGRVSYYRKDLKRISEHSWNRIVAKLIRTSGANYLPLFIEGHNSPWFYRLGRVHEALRMLRLGHELLNKQGHSVHIQTGHPIKAADLAKDGDLAEQAALCRAMSYCQDSRYQGTWPAENQQAYNPLARAVEQEALHQSIIGLPQEQCLHSQQEFAVYYGYQGQMPLVVAEIARLREWVFRQYNEGSGEPQDTDAFDATFTHLFIYHTGKKQILGAYRMGQTDKLLSKQGIKGLYLARMFDFSPDFINQQLPCLELGRSFLIPEFQRSYMGLYLLWKGIGAFLCKYPQYRHLYGTVSVSKLYRPQSVALIKKALVQNTLKVKEKVPFEHSIHPELLDFAQQYSLPKHLDNLIKVSEIDGKGLPVLVKQYQKLGARFCALGLDGNFNQTPGLLLHVDMHKAPTKQLARFMGDAYHGYLKGGKT